MKTTIIVFLMLVFFNINISYSQYGWFQQNSGTYSTLNSVCFIDQNTGWTAGQNGTIRNTTNGGDNWLFQNSGTSRTLNSIFFADAQTGYTVGGESPIETIVLKTSNGGNNWVRLNFIPPAIEAYSVFFINANTGFISGNINAICKTTDGGVTWIYCGSSGNANWLRSLYFVDQNIGWLIGRDMYSLNANILKTTDGAYNWSVIYTGTGYKEHKSLHFQDTNLGYAVGDSGVIIKTTDGGNNWLNLNSGTVNNLNSIDIISPSYAWAVGGYANTILMSSNSGQNWFFQPVNQSYLKSVDFVSALTGWAVGDAGKIFKTTSGGLTYLSEIENHIPKKFTLYQNYPNPFNPVTKIKFDVASVGNGRDRSVQLIVYDILGREITTLVNEPLKPGTYEVEWDGSNYPSGIYFYKLATEEYSETKRMILLK